MRQYRTMVAVGDSFTEGMCDDVLPDGHFRGWADRVAAALAAEAAGAAEDGQSGQSGAAGGSGFRYANLAVRGKLIGQIRAEQVDLAAATDADLVTLAGGLNDVLRPGCDVALVERLLGECVRGLLAEGRTVVLFTSTDPTRRMAGSGRLLPAILRMKAYVEGVVRENPGRVVLVDLFSAPAFDDRRLWAEDRLHLSPEGHRRVALAVLEALGRPSAEDWRAPLSEPDPRTRGQKARADVRWLGTHVGPWIGRRLRGRSSGDGRPAKRPDLLPYEG
ncbi:SGNH/GDSL hydrolase family protein [Kitasatospora sp. NPDC004272]